MGRHCENQILELERYARMLTQFLYEYRFIIDCYVLDYFVDNHWEKIPLSWRIILEKMETDDIAKFLNSKQSPRLTEVWPLSLLAFRATNFALSLPREAIKSTLPVKKFIQQCFNEPVKLDDYHWVPSEFNSNSQVNKNLPEMCRKHVKPKKQHEIHRLSQVIDIVLKGVDIERVVDVGSGVGHLSRLLSFQYNFNVLAIEGVPSHTSSASNFDNQALTSLKKKTKDKRVTLMGKVVLTPQNVSFVKLPRHFEGHIANDCYDYFNEVLQEAWGSKVFSKSENDSFSVLGLHACGDLSATVAKLFTYQKKAKVLFSVGCCYMKLNADDSCGYPLSDIVKTLPHNFLSYEARELSCHAIEKYQSRLEENSRSLKIHCFRALLEKIIIAKYPHLRHAGLKSIRSTENITFAEYANNALCKRKVDIPKEDFFSAEIETCIQEWKKVVVLYSLRLLTGPVIESLILVDKMLYLLENGCFCCIFPIFEPNISPRNHLLLAFKKDIHAK